MGGDGEGVMTVRVPGPPEVMFTPEPVNAIRVGITDPAGYLGRSGFRDGDLIIALEGTEFEGTRQIQLLFATNESKEQCTFTVLRGGERLEISANMRKLRPDAELGGDLEPATR